MGPIKTDKLWPIHRAAPSYEDQQPISEIFETGIKVVDLLCPFAKGGKIGLFGGAGVGKTVLIQELIRITAVEKVASPCSPAWASARAKATISGSRCARPSSSAPMAPKRPSSTTQSWCSAR